MTTATPSTALATIQPAFTDAERFALAGFLAGYRGLTREAYALDLRQFPAPASDGEVVAQQAFLVQRRQELGEEERVALGFAEDQAGQGFAERGRRMQRVGHQQMAEFVVRLDHPVRRGDPVGRAVDMKRERPGRRQRNPKSIDVRQAAQPTDGC